jgi:class 3 adenylate cyclase/pimeloyl-ACP methyl ester carboxylesterase
MEIPETRYAQSEDVSIAYTVTGEGPFDLVFVPGFVSNVELDWADPQRARFLTRLGSFSRLIMLDKRGTGLSDRVSGAPTLEVRMDDIRAVMDAAGSERAALLGLADGGSLGVLFAATHAKRTLALILYATAPRFTKSPGFPWAPTREEAERAAADLVRRWGTVELATEALGANGEAAERLSALMRQSASPGSAAALARMNLDVDVTHVLPAVHVPTLVLHRTGHPIDVRGGRYLADKITGARFVELPGSEAFPYLGDWERLIEEIERFLTGLRDTGLHEPEPGSDRILATILFTDIVGSTAKAAELGDRGWRELLTEHHGLIRWQLVHHGGIELDTAGDGFFARFDGPARAIRCAAAIRDAVGELGLEIRAGLHTGECQLVDGKVAGIAVSIGARVAAQAGPGEVLVSQTVKDLVAGSGIEFDDRGAAALKGVPGEWRLYAVAA